VEISSIFIIAEVGSNFLSFEDAKNSISLAKQCGASAVKFQLFSPKDLYGQGSEDTLLPLDWIPKLKEKADACGIEWMCTAFSPLGVEAINPYVKRHKIASAEITHIGLLRAVRETKKPCIISIGAASHGDIALALNELGRDQISLLYCRANYPARNIDLRAIPKLRETFGINTGYSCHSSEYWPAVTACLHYGATILEKHFKIREMNTPDNPHSLLPEEFKKMVELIKSDPPIQMPDPSEKEMLLKHKRRLIALSDINPGEVFEFGKNYGIYRSQIEDMHGLSGFAWEEINLKPAKKPLKFGDPIGPGDF